MLQRFELDGGWLADTSHQSIRIQFVWAAQHGKRWTPK